MERDGALEGYTFATPDTVDLETVHRVRMLPGAPADLTRPTIRGRPDTPTNASLSLDLAFRYAGGEATIPATLGHDGRLYSTYTALVDECPSEYSIYAVLLTKDGRRGGFEVGTEPQDGGHEAPTRGGEQPLGTRAHPFDERSFAQLPHADPARPALIAAHAYRRALELESPDDLHVAARH